jgi:LuxR family maltose regulon positive regulatory protein
MTGPLLQTKLHMPQQHRNLVARWRLRERLSHQGGRPVTLVSAPAGFGKTTLLAEWLAAAPAGGSSSAWLSLDHRDNDPALFWSYLLAAVQKAEPGVGADALVLLQSPQWSTEAVLATLLNDFHALSKDVVLVLDDYHVIESRDVQDGIVFLVENLPPQVRLVIAARADPALPLARLRARGALTEVRAADLRFTPDEVAEYLNGIMGLGLTEQDVAALERRTEGWAAALQLAALSLMGRDDVAGFIDGFAGDDRFIVDYLAEEVLARQTDAVRAFLLRTAILSRLTGPLCDAVTGRTGGANMLETLDRANLFLVPLDDRRRWYRYHHLFADVLRARLLAEQPDQVRHLHLLASRWYADHGEPGEAIRHAMAGADLERAAELIELAMPEMRRSRQEATVRGWLDALPRHLIRDRPLLGIGYAGALMVYGEVDGVEEILRDVERALPTAARAAPEADRASSGLSVRDEELRRVPASVAMYRAGQALIRGDAAGTSAHAQRALDLAGAEDHLERGSAAALLGLANWTGGDLVAAHRWYGAGAASLEKAGHFSDVTGCLIAVADLEIALGRLHDAMSTYERGLQLATRPDGRVRRGAADMHVGLGEVLSERNELDASLQHLLISRDLGEAAGMPQHPYRWRVEMARLRQAGGDVTGAIDLLDEAERRYVGDFFPEVRPVAAIRARARVARGDFRAALDWAAARALSVDDDPEFLREYEHVTLARLLLAQSSAEGAETPQRAMRLLGRLLRSAEEGQRTRSVIEILILQACAHRDCGDVPAALAALHRAVTLAEPEGFVRLFADEGSVVTALLRALLKQGGAGDGVPRLLRAISGSDAHIPRQQGMVERLSGRELDVLRLLATDLDGPDIARELVVSLNTVRTHTKNIYSKLGTNNRRAAVRRAQELDLLSRDR